MRVHRSLSIAAPTIVALSVIGAVVSIIAKWPHQFGGHGDPHRMLHDFVSGGTALAPPLPVLVVFAIVAIAVRRSDLWGRLAAFALLPLSILMAVGSIGEAAAASTPDVPRTVQLLSGAFGTAAAAILLVLAAGSIRERRTRGVASAKNPA